jgi:hypothetical protein
MSKDGSHTTPFDTFSVKKNLNTDTTSKSASSPGACDETDFGNFPFALTVPDSVSHWSLTTLRDRLVKIGAKIVHDGRSITFQMAEVMVPRTLFQHIIDAIAALRPLPRRDAERRRKHWRRRLSAEEPHSFVVRLSRISARTAITDR